MALSKNENKQFGDKCLPFVVRSVASNFGFDFHVCPRQMSVSPTMGLHITAYRQTDAKLRFRSMCLCTGRCRACGAFSRTSTSRSPPRARATWGDMIPQEIRRVLDQSGVDFAGRSQSKGEVINIELHDITA